MGLSRILVVYSWWWVDFCVGRPRPLAVIGPEGVNAVVVVVLEEGSRCRTPNLPRLTIPIVVTLVLHETFQRLAASLKLTLQPESCSLPYWHEQWTTRKVVASDPIQVMEWKAQNGLMMKAMQDDIESIGTKNRGTGVQDFLNSKSMIRS